MKPRSLALILTALLLACAVTACKPQEELEAYREPEPTVISPDVNITHEEDAPDTITVSGTGKVMLTPDIATFRISIRTTEKEASLAQENNALIAEAVLASLHANGVDEADIKTTGINLYEEYDYSDNTPKLTGYTMENSLSVTVRSIDSVGKVISDAIAAGATGTHGLSFSVADSSEGYGNALSAAISDAQYKAEVMAKTLGVTLLPVPVSTVETSASYTPTVYRGEMNDSAAEEAPMASAAPSAVPVSEGELSVTARVSVVYAVEAAAAEQ